MEEQRLRGGTERAECYLTTNRVHCLVHRITRERITSSLDRGGCSTRTWSRWLVSADGEEFDRLAGVRAVARLKTALCSRYPCPCYPRAAHGCPLYLLSILVGHNAVGRALSFSSPLPPFLHALYPSYFTRPLSAVFNAPAGLWNEGGLVCVPFVGSRGLESSFGSARSRGRCVWADLMTFAGGCLLEIFGFSVVVVLIASF